MNTTHSYQIFISCHANTFLFFFLIAAVRPPFLAFPCSNWRIYTIVPSGTHFAVITCTSLMPTELSGTSRYLSLYHHTRIHSKERHLQDLFLYNPIIPLRLLNKKRDTSETIKKKGTRVSVWCRVCFGVAARWSTLKELCTRVSSRSITTQFLP